MSNLITLNFQHSDTVRIFLDENGTPLFVAKDVAKTLGYANTKDAIARHCRGVVKHYPLPTQGGTQAVRVIYEPDVYRLIFGSKLQSATQFQDWVFNEVLPSIRKTGQYTAPTKPTDQLTDKDWTNLKRLVWLCENNFRMKGSAGHAIWARLRAVTGIKSPEKFSTHHLPILATELERIFRLSEQYSRAVQATEQLIIRNVLKYGDDEPMAFFLAEMAQKATDYQTLKDERLPAFFSHDHQKLIDRI